MVMSLMGAGMAGTVSHLRPGQRKARACQGSGHDTLHIASNHLDRQHSSPGHDVHRNDTRQFLQPHGKLSCLPGIRNSLQRKLQAFGPRFIACLADRFHQCSGRKPLAGLDRQTFTGKIDGAGGNARHLGGGLFHPLDAGCACHSLDRNDDWLDAVNGLGNLVHGMESFIPYLDRASHHGKVKRQSARSSAAVPPQAALIQAAVAFSS